MSICVTLCAAALAGEPPALRPGVVFDAPGHVYTDRETPTAHGGEPGASWTLLDWRGRETGVSGVFDANGCATLPPLPAGYYRMLGGRFVETPLPDKAYSGRDAPTARPHGQILATLAVVPVPESRVSDCDSFFGTDSAQSWCAGKGAFLCPWNGGDTFRTVSDLLWRVGVPHVRDRLSWGQVNPDRDTLDLGRYIYNADLLRARGISGLGVFHDTAPWVEKLRKLPADLNVLYGFCASLGAAFGDRMDGWEFWNEEELDCNVPEPVWDFAATMKAAYLGFKAGRPGLTVLHGALSDGALHPGKAYGRVLYDNDAAKFCDAFNYHTYSPIAQYPGLFAPIHRLQERHGVGDRAIWVTESGTYLDGPATAEGAMKGKKAHSPAQELVHAEFYAKSQSAFQMQGVARNYFFIFGAFNGGSQDWGVMRRDGTVKPVFSAMATATRELVSARLAGELKVGEGLRAYLYDQPDGSQTVAFWSVSPIDTQERGAVSPEPDFARELRLALPDEGPFRLSDMCGMVSAISATNGAVALEATRFPAYLSGLRGLTADVPARPAGKVKPYVPAADEDLTVVIRVNLDGDDFEITDRQTRARLNGETGRIRVQVWNFGDTTKTGHVEAAGCALEGLPETITLGPRGTQPVEFDCVLRPGKDAPAMPTLVLTGVFNGRRSSRLAMPMLLPDRLFGNCVATPLDWRDTAKWKNNDSARTCDISWDETEKAIRFDLEWIDPNTDRWFYPAYALRRPKESLGGAVAIQFEVKSVQDKVENDYNYTLMMLEEKGQGERHLGYSPPAESWERRVILLDPSDPLEGVEALCIGGNPRGMKCSFWIRNLEILRGL